MDAFPCSLWKPRSVPESTWSPSGLKEEAGREIETLAVRTHWISLGQLSKLIEICHSEKIAQLMMCGQVKHAKIFLFHRAGSEAAVKLLTSRSNKEKYRGADWRHRKSAGRRRNRVGRFHAVAERPAGTGGCLNEAVFRLQDETRDIDYGSKARQRRCKIGRGAERCRSRARLRGHRGDGGDRCDAAPRGVVGRKKSRCD